MGKIKYLSLFAALLTLILSSFPQEIQHEAVAINIEVPVRVFKGNEFIDHLTLEDFEIYEKIPWAPVQGSSHIWPEKAITYQFLSGKNHQPG